MSTLIAPLIAWLVGSVVTWLAGRYHLDASQQQQITVDLIGAAGSAASGVSILWLHWRARIAPPPNGGNNVQAPRGIGGGTGVFGPGPRSGPQSPPA